MQKKRKNNIIAFGENRAEDKILTRLEPFCEGEGLVVRKTEKEKDLWSFLEKEEVALALFLIQGSRSKQERALSVVRKIRENTTLPLIVITDAKEDIWKVCLLDAGADDVVLDEVNPLELLARVKSQIRRYWQLTEISDGPVYQEDYLVMDDCSKLVRVKEREVKLTHTEYEILKLLLLGKGKVFSVEQIYREIWKETPIGVDNIVAVHIRHLRMKIEENPADPKFVKAVWGMGYKVG